MKKKRIGMTKEVRAFVKVAQARLKSELRTASPERKKELRRAEQEILKIVERGKNERISLDALVKEVTTLEKSEVRKRANLSGRSYLNWQIENLPMPQAGSPGLGKKR